MQYPVREPHALYPTPATVTDEHGAHALWPAAAANVLTAHALQAVVPLAPAKVPGAHALHAVRFETVAAKVPTGQGAHVVSFAPAHAAAM